jgi:hypothetical protein
MALFTYDLCLDKITEPLGLGGREEDEEEDEAMMEALWQVGWASGQVRSSNAPSTSCDTLTTPTL